MKQHILDNQELKIFLAQVGSILKQSNVQLNLIDKNFNFKKRILDLLLSKETHELITNVSIFLVSPLVVTPLVQDIMIDEKIPPGYWNRLIHLDILSDKVEVDWVVKSLKDQSCDPDITIEALIQEKIQGYASLPHSVIVSYKLRKITKAFARTGYKYWPESPQDCICIYKISTDASKKVAEIIAKKRAKLTQLESINSQLSALEVQKKQLETELNTEGEWSINNNTKKPGGFRRAFLIIEE